VSDEKKGNTISNVPTSPRPGRESVIGTMQHPALAAMNDHLSPPASPGFPNTPPPGVGAQKVDVVGTVASPTSASFMIPPQPQPHQLVRHRLHLGITRKGINYQGYQVPPSPLPASPGFAPAH
jgi:hypothetical protein